MASEESRKQMALEIGLPENATWKEINDFDSEKYKKH